MVRCHRREDDSVLEHWQHELDRALLRAECAPHEASWTPQRPFRRWKQLSCFVITLSLLLLSRESRLYTKENFNIRILPTKSVAIFLFCRASKKSFDLLSGFACLSLNTHLDLSMSDIIVSSHTIQF